MMILLSVSNNCGTICIVFIPFASSDAFCNTTCLGASDKIQPDPPKKMPKKQYAKANITNSADRLIRKELDDADDVLQKVSYCTDTI